MLKLHFALGVFQIHFLERTKSCEGALSILSPLILLVCAYNQQKRTERGIFVCMFIFNEYPNYTQTPIHILTHTQMLLLTQADEDTCILLPAHAEDVCKKKKSRCSVSLKRCGRFLTHNQHAHTA